MEIEHPELLTVLKTELMGLMGARHYAADPNGNVWLCTETNGKSGEWRLYKTAAEVAAQQPTPSFQDMVNGNKN